MFVGSSMEYNLDTASIEQLGHHFQVADIGNAIDDLRCFVAFCLAQRLLEVEDGGFVLVNTDKNGRAVGYKLPAELRTDGTRGTADHNDSVPNLGGHCLEVQVHRLPTQ